MQSALETAHSLALSLSLSHPPCAGIRQTRINEDRDLQHDLALTAASHDLKSEARQADLRGNVRKKCVWIVRPRDSRDQSSSRSSRRHSLWTAGLLALSAESALLTRRLRLIGFRK